MSFPTTIIILIFLLVPLLNLTYAAAETDDKTPIDLQCYINQNDYYQGGGGSHTGSWFEDTCEASDNIQGTFHDWRSRRGFTCQIEFFHHQSSSSTTESIFSQQTSELCQSATSILKIKAVMYDWNDECVTDFSRCYSVATHLDDLMNDQTNNKSSRENPFRDNLCHANVKNLPAGTTHWTVDCSQAAQKNRAQQAGMVVNLVAISVLVGVCCFCGCRKIWRELQKTAKAHNESRNANDQLYTLCSMMICGISCLIQKHVTSFASEREGIMNSGGPSLEMT
jgi:hypothetical protein